MERIIKFRALDRNTGRWEILTLSELANADSSSWCDVDMETVGESTGLHDKNRKEIYDGDIVKEHKENTHTVSFNSKHGGFTPFTLCHNGGWECGSVNSEDCEVIGNVWEAPNLIP